MKGWWENPFKKIKVQSSKTKWQRNIKFQSKATSKNVIPAKQESKIKSKTQKLLDTRLRGYDRMVEFIFLIRIVIVP
jgi:hypothetical protein